MVGPRNTLEMEKDMDGSLNNLQVRTETEMEKLEKLQRSRQLPERMQGLMHLASAVDDQLDLLTTVLGPVLRPREDTGPEMAAVTTPAETELASFLQEMAGRLARVHDYLAELVGRVDL